MPRRKVSKLLSKPNIFSGTVHGVAGVWERGHHSKRGKFSGSTKKRATSVRLLVAYETKANYQPRFKFFERAEKTAKVAFKYRFKQAMTKAIATAR